jgi:hypothetical protein
MMNDPTVLEASRVMAQRLVQEKLSPERTIKKAFHRIICRVAGDKEYGILKSYYEEQLQQFSKKNLDATATLLVGEYAFEKNLDINVTAALMKVITIIYNMEEAIVKS